MAEDLNALAAEAAAIDAEAAPAALPVENALPAQNILQSSVDMVESLAGLLNLLGIAAGYAKFDKTAAMWTPDTCRGLSAKTVPVLQKYVWGQRLLNFLATGAGVEEMALVVYATPLVLATFDAVRDDMKPNQPAKPAEKPEANHAGQANE